MYQLLALPHLLLANEILQRFTVRVHSRIVEKGRSWARLWYTLRSLDSRGSGFLSLPVVAITHLLGASSSTCYQWLREAKKCGAIRWWKCQRGILRIALGGLFALTRCLNLSSDQKGIAPWGVTAEIGLHQVLDLKSLRAAATVATAQRLQQLSRFAAWRKLPPAARKAYRLPQPEAFFVEGQQRASNNSARGAIRCCIHISRKRIWASKGFVPFGASQEAIAQERGMSTRTIRRHLNLLEINRRQIVQSKGEYRLAADCLAHDGGGVEPSEDVTLRSQDDSYFLNEKTLGGSYTHKVGEVTFARIQTRFFSYGAKPKTWLYRCNLYQPTLHLCSMSAARNELRTTTFSRRGEVTSCNSLFPSFEIQKELTPSQAEKDGQNP